MANAIIKFFNGCGEKWFEGRFGVSITFSFETCKFWASLVSFTLCKNDSYNFLLLSTSLENLSIPASFSSITLSSLVAFCNSSSDNLIKLSKLLNSNAFCWIFSSKISLSWIFKFSFNSFAWTILGCLSVYIKESDWILLSLAFKLLFMAEISSRDLKSSIASKASTSPSATLIESKSFCCSW